MTGVVALGLEMNRGRGGDEGGEGGGGEGGEGMRGRRRGRRLGYSPRTNGTHRGVQKLVFGTRIREWLGKLR